MAKISNFQFNSNKHKPLQAVVAQIEVKKITAYFIKTHLKKYKNIRRYKFYVDFK